MTAHEHGPHAATAHQKTTKLKALVTLIAAMAMSAGFLVLCGLLNNQEFYAGFLFLLCWTVMEHAKLERLPHTIIGSAFGLSLGYLLQYLLGNSIPMGGWIFTAIVMIVLYCQFLSWLPLVANLTAFTFLLVVTIPHIQSHGSFRDAAIALALGIVYFGPIIGFAMHMQNKPKISDS